MTQEYLTRIDSIHIGTDVDNKFVWTGIKSVSFADVSPWVHIGIPSGTMQHQHLLSPHVEGQINCYDLVALSTALYKTTIDGNSHTAIVAATNTKYVVTYFVMNMITHTGETVTWVFTNFRVETISVGNIETGKEAVIIVRFSADLATPSTAV